MKPIYRKSWARNLFMFSDLTLGPLLQSQTRIAKFKSAYNSLFIGPRGLQCAKQQKGNYGLGISCHCGLAGNTLV